MTSQQKLVLNFLNSKSMITTNEIFLSEYSAIKIKQEYNVDTSFSLPFLQKYVYLEVYMVIFLFIIV
jgi:hypothetical protein